MIQRRLFICLVSAFLVVCSISNGATLEEARLHYENGLQVSDQKHASGKQSALKKYMGELKQARGILKAKGGDDYNAVVDELTRVGVIGAIDTFDSNSQYVTAAKNNYNEMVSKLDDQKKMACVNLGKKWIEFLEKEKEKLENAGKKDEAAMVVYELDAVIQEVAALDAGLPIGTKMVMGDCTKCKGTGRGGRPCLSCKGSKNCKACKGLGKRKAAGIFMKCSGCQGGGNCRTCKGEGETIGVCSMCKGQKRCYIPDPNVDPVFGVPGLKMAEFQYEDRKSKRIKKQPGGMKEYIANMVNMNSSFKAGKAVDMRLSKVVVDPDSHLGKLYKGKAVVISAFPRGVIVAVKVDDEAMGIELTPHSQAIGVAATKLFESLGKGAKVSIIYGFANSDKPVLFEMKSL